MTDRNATPIPTAAANAVTYPQAASFRESRVAVLVPCHNEEESVAEVVRDFARLSPHKRRLRL